MLKSIRVFHLVPLSSLTSTAICFLYGMVFVGAFLLFIMEPMVGRLLTPYFGGAVHVWLTSMMFFQAMLVVGYLYAYLLAHRLGRWHLIIIIFPLLNLPLKIVSGYAPDMPILTLLSILFTHIALPFAVLSTTAVVGQLWLAQSNLNQADNPYPLYALSNAGSLLALVGYPFFIEPFLGLRLQSFFWMVGYLVYILLVIITWYAIRPDCTSNLGRLKNQFSTLAVNAPKVSDYFRWLWLSFLPSGLLLAVTNFIALEMGSFPLIWIAPLALYLGSFIITFRTEGGVPKVLVKFWPVILLLGIIFFLRPTISFFQFAIHLLVFFIACLYAHGELYELRPQAGYLTNFYLVIALGGWLGGIFVSLIAPQIFNGLFEYPLIFLLLCLTIAWTQSTNVLSWWRQLKLVFRFSYVLFIGFFLVLSGYIGFEYLEKNQKCIHSHRSFYGISRVVDLPPGDDSPKGFRVLIHGQTRHGGEYLDDQLQGEPTTYYHRGSFDDVFKLVPSPRTFAVVGLGVGTLSAYTTSTDAITFFEIDPANKAIALSYFTYLRNSKGSVQIISGDGRLSLEQAAKDHSQYPLIIIDAFSGDGIPTHLLTREAIQIYLRCLAEDGLLIFHISNRYYDLNPVLKAASEEMNIFGCMNNRSLMTKIKKFDSIPDCVVLAKKRELLKPLFDQGWIAYGPEDGLRTVSPWSDNYINILDPLVEKIRKSNKKSNAMGRE